MARFGHKQLFLTLWLVSPIVVVACLCCWIVVAMARGPEMQNDRLGQGARDTGGANALGEMLAGHSAKQRAHDNRAVREGRAVRADEFGKPIKILLRLPGEGDVSRGAGAIVPDLVLFDARGDQIERRVFEDLGSGVWGLDVQPGELPIGVQYRIESGDGALVESTELGKPLSPRPLPLIPKDAADSGIEPRILLEVARLGAPG